MRNKKGTKIIEILDGIKTPLKYKNFLKLEDNWVSKNDKFLYDKNGKSYTVLEFEEIEENTNVLNTIHCDGWKNRKYSCIKLDSVIDINTILYTN